MNGMKKILALIGIVFVVLAVQSCSGGHQVCAAYSQHESTARPTYDKVQ